MTTQTEDTRRVETPGAEMRHVAWFHELDAWTEYWDIYHPETRGRYYFGDGKEETGLLTLLLPKERRPRVFMAWTEMALGNGSREEFEQEMCVPELADAAIEVDEMIAGLFRKHFGEASAAGVVEDYVEAMLACARDTLPPATERDQKIAEGDWRKSTAGRHIIDADMMWFAWAFHLEAVQMVDARPEERARRALQMAGVAMGIGANFAWRGHRRTREEYRSRDEAALRLLRERGMRWATDFDAGASEVHALFRIREWGHE